MHLVASIWVLFASNGTPAAPTMGEALLRQLIAAIMFSAIGIVVLGVAWWIMVKICPFSVRQEIEQDHNVSLAIVLGAVIIGMSIIIAAAVHG